MLRCSSSFLPAFLPKSCLTPAVLTSTMATRSAKKTALAPRFEVSRTNVWVQYAGLAAKHKAVNLGQGFPDFAPPDTVKQALSESATGDNAMLHQYTRPQGHPRLVNALAKMYNQLNYALPLDPLKNFVIASGAYEAIATVIQSLVHPGDEVILVEPFFDCYFPMVESSGGVTKFISLKPKQQSQPLSSNDWELDFTELEKLFSKKTKLLVLNNPNNPIGKVFRRDEMERIAELCIKHDVVVLSDEVYEWLIYPGHEHIRMGNIPGMANRTVTIGSAGKTFSATGWKLGWAYGPEDLITQCMIVHQNVVFQAPTIIQEAVAIGIELETPRLGSPACYFQVLPAELLLKRKRMEDLILLAGLKPIIPDGGYFMLAEFSPKDLKSNNLCPDDPLDVQFSKWLVSEKGISVIPPSFFYGKEHANEASKYIRFCFAKKEETLDAADVAIRKWKGL